MKQTNAALENKICLVMHCHRSNFDFARCFRYWKLFHNKMVWK